MIVAGSTLVIYPISNTHLNIVFNIHPADSHHTHLNTRTHFGYFCVRAFQKKKHKSPCALFPKVYVAFMSIGLFTIYI